MIQFRASKRTLTESSMAKTKRIRPEPVSVARGQCLCGAVEVEIDVPVRWAWHDHSQATRRAHGAAYATYAGAWRSKSRVAKGQEHITRYEEPETHYVRRFCARCGTPLMYQRRDRNMINFPR